MSIIDFNGKLVFLTGATRGIGREIYHDLISAGATVIGTGTFELRPEGMEEYYQADFSSEDSIHDCANYLRKIEPEILINNAGININNPFIDINPRDFLLIQQVNLFAPFCLSQAVLPGMKSKGWGRIVNVSSIWGKKSKEYRAAYSASKFALDGMTLALALEHAKDGILANCVAPGFTDTELTRKTLGDVGINKLVDIIPIGRMAQPKEISKFITWLASPENTYITGQSIAIDGGFTRG
jgi:NAD(P)-dependent dehydrogenase (short-subunit alcohol dehydrogenase family)